MSHTALLAACERGSIYVALLPKEFASLVSVFFHLRGIKQDTFLFPKFRPHGRSPMVFHALAARAGAYANKNVSRQEQNGTK